MNIGLFFGSFNPVHIGHLILGNALVAQGYADKVWYIVSPHNPLKPIADLLHVEDRYAMLQVATADNPDLSVSDNEIGMSMPSYTIDTLTKLKALHPNHNFSLIMGADNIVTFHKWKAYQKIADENRLLVFSRGGASFEHQQATKHAISLYPNATLTDTPVIDLSASHIRRLIKDAKSTQYLLLPEVEGYIKLKKLYQ